MIKREDCQDSQLYSPRLLDFSTKKMVGEFGAKDYRGRSKAFRRWGGGRKRLTWGGWVSM